MLSASFQMHVGANIEYWGEKVKNMPRAHHKQLQMEHPNLQRALEFGLRVKTSRTNALSLALDIFPLLDGEATDPVWFKIYEKAIDAAEDQTVKARLLNQLGFLYSQTRQGQASLGAHNKAETISKERQLDTIIARAYLGKSQAYWLLDKVEDSLTYAKQALQDFETLKGETVSDEAIALAHNAMGLALHSQEKYEEAQNEFRKALVRIKDSTKLLLLGRLHNNRAFSFQEDGMKIIENSPSKSTRSLEKSVGHFSKAITIYKALGKTKQLARVELSRCNLHIRLGNHTEAEKALSRVKSGSSNWAADHDFQAQVAYNYGQLAFSKRDWTEAQANYQNALYLWNQADDELMQAQISLNLSEVYHHQSKPQEQKAELLKAQGLLERLPDRRLRKRLLLEVETKLNDPANLL